MKNLVMFLKLSPSLLFACLLYSCGSGEYDVDEYTADYVEKIVKVDTLPKAEERVVVREELKEEFLNPLKKYYTYVVQIGAFVMPTNSERFFEKARNLLGSDVYNIQVDSFNKIRIGKFTDKNDALNFLNRVRSLGFYDAFLVTSKP